MTAEHDKWSLADQARREPFAWQAATDNGPTSDDPRDELAWWLVEIGDRLPGADPATVATFARHCLVAALRPWDTSSDNGSLANARADVGDVAGLTRHALLATMVPGDVEPLRAMHAWLVADQADVPDHAPEPDTMDGARHTVIRKRARSGRTSSEVRDRGVAQCQGSWRPWWLTSPSSTWQADHRAIVAWWEREQATRANLRYGLVGANVIGLQQATRRTFGHQLPGMLGTDLIAYQQVIEAGAGTVDTFGVTVRHDDIGGYASTSALRDAMRGRARSVDQLDGSLTLDDDSSTWARALEPGLTWETRESLPAIVARDSELALCQSTPVIGPAIERSPHGARCVELVAPGPDVEHVWIGHQLHPRGPLARQTDIKAARTDDGPDVLDVDTLTSTVDGLAPGRRVVFDGDVWHASLTRAAKSGRYSARLVDGDGIAHQLDGARTTGRVVTWLVERTTGEHVRG